MEGWSFRDSVCTSTPGTSVREFSGPVGCRPILRVGRRSRIRGRASVPSPGFLEGAGLVGRVSVDMIYSGIMLKKKFFYI